MGFFKNIRRLKQQGEALSACYDVGERMADAQAQMAMGTQLMAQHTANAGAMVSGINATATIVDVEPAGDAPNQNSMLSLNLMVTVPGMPPYPASVKEVVAQPYLNRAVAGANLRCRVDPDNPQAIVLDWFSPA